MLVQLVEQIVLAVCDANTRALEAAAETPAQDRIRRHLLL